MNAVKIRDVIIGEGMPKICVPIVAKDDNELKVFLDAVVKAKPDIIEFRADIYGRYEDEASVKNALMTIREAIGNTVLLYTVRTSGEGGEAFVDAKKYMGLLMNVIESGLVDMVDVEAFIQDGVLS